MQLALIGMLRPPAVNFNLDLLCQLAAQVIHVDAGSAIDLRRIFACE
jgi:hypothetical protein